MPLWYRKYSSFEDEPPSATRLEVPFHQTYYLIMRLGTARANQSRGESNLKRT